MYSTLYKKKIINYVGTRTQYMYTISFILSSSRLIDRMSSELFFSNERNKFAKELNTEFNVFDIDIIAAKSSELH